MCAKFKITISLLTIICIVIQKWSNKRAIVLHIRITVLFSSDKDENFYLTKRYRLAVGQHLSAGRLVRAIVASGEVLLSIIDNFLFRLRIDNLVETIDTWATFSIVLREMYVGDNASLPKGQYVLHIRCKIGTRTALVRTTFELIRIIDKFNR